MATLKFQLDWVEDDSGRWLENIDLAFQAASWTAILGRSGVGKTTLLKAMAGLLSTHASARWDTHSPRVVWMSQQSALLPWCTALENVLIGARLRGKLTSDDRIRAKACLAAVGLEDKAQQGIKTLSGGMQQRVNLARVLFEEGDVVCLDEPFSALDVATKTELYPLIQACLRDKIVVQITHDPAEALQLADQIYVLAGKPAQIAWSWDLAECGYARGTPQFDQAQISWGREMIRIMQR